ncbi:VOC family protein [Runella sp. MFBS21]|uniref:VOC family protein n=1 Tax=Runella sp. MFBS21 TaxID=3034018 RepID=UPI0023F7764D|nr:VOC family protein [Runella sp. MFBS21]MDF7819909.1 VOC family protein [Runella sp. MFBS21]
MIQTSFFHVAVTVKDLSAFESFYSKYFGFQRARTISLGEGKELVFLKDAGNFYFEVFPPDEERPIPLAEGDGPHYQGIRHLAFSVEDVDAKLAEMGSDAVITLGPLTFDDFIPGWKTAWVKDPEGNIIEITQGYVDEASQS